MKNKKREIIIVSCLIMIQTIIFFIVGMHKEYIHMDEAYSYGLASYKRTEIQDNEDFYNKWHNGEYYEDYLSVQENEIKEYSQVYENQKNDVHPPLYYLLLRFFMGFTNGKFSMWPGIVLNIIIYNLITIVMDQIIQKLLKKEKYVKEKAIILAFISSITVASLTNVIYIRMYALTTLNILLTTFLHIKLLEENRINVKLLIEIGMIALIGSLTHYYYLFYLTMLYILFLIKYIKEKNIKALIYYTITMIMAAAISLMIFPYSINHMFFGYRGQGVINNLTNVSHFVFNIIVYLFKINYYTFNNLLFFIFIFIMGILIYKKRKRKEKIENDKKQKELFQIIYIPTIFYFIIVAIVSPWLELRYVLPICGLIFILVIIDLYQLLKTILEEQKVNIIVGILLIVTLITPLIYKIEPEVLYSNKKDIVQKIQKELNVPTIYLLNSKNNRFLDDILLFTTIKQSYIAKDIEYTSENIQNILQEKDMTNGIMIFINDGQNKSSIIQVIRKTTNLKKVEHLKRMNACDIYYIYE